MILENKYRTCDLGSLRIEDVGKTVRLAGFVDTIRKLGGITFVVLRDFYGKTQMELANEIGISQAQISRLEKSGLANIKKMMQ